MNRHYHYQAPMTLTALGERLVELHRRSKETDAKAAALINEAASETAALMDEAERRIRAGEAGDTSFNEWLRAAAPGKEAA